MSTETTNKKIKIDNGTTFGRTYTDKAIDAKLPTDLIATAKKLSLGAGNTALGNGVNLDGFTYDEATKTLKVSGGGIPVVRGAESATTTDGAYATYTIPEAQTSCFIFKCDLGTAFVSYNDVFGTYNGYLDASGDVTDGSLKLNDLIVLSGSGTTIDIFFGNIGGGGGGGGGNVVTIEVASMPDTQTTIDVSAITNDTQFVNIKETSTNKNYLLYRVGSDFASCWSNEFTQGTIIGFYYIDTQQKQLYYFISSVGKMGKIFGNHDIQVPAVSSNNILPCTTADNGKVLSVVNGEAQWANAGGGSTNLYKHNIVLRENSNSEYLYIKHISSKQSKVASIADLNTLLGTDLYFFECSGEVKINGTWYNAVAIYWGGSYAKSRVVYNVPSEGEKTASLTIYTGINDNVKPVE